MHELAAPLFYVLDQDAREQAQKGRAESQKKDTDPLVKSKTADAEDWDTFCSIDCVESDTFTLFIRIMNHCKAWYEFESPDRTALLPIIAKGHEIQGRTRLGRVDPVLGEHLTRLQLSPQFYCLRWLRLLFGREFEFDQVLSVWDALFTNSIGLELVDWIAVAMLMQIRQECKATPITDTEIPLTLLP